MQLTSSSTLVARSPQAEPPAQRRTVNAALWSTLVVSGHFQDQVSDVSAGRRSWDRTSDPSLVRRARTMLRRLAPRTYAAVAQDGDTEHPRRAAAGRIYLIRLVRHEPRIHILRHAGRIVCQHHGGIADDEDVRNDSMKASISYGFREILQFEKTVKKRYSSRRPMRMGHSRGALPMCGGRYTGPVEPAYRQHLPPARQHRRQNDLPYDQDALATEQDLAPARLLTVQGYGHTEFSNPSTCALRERTAPSSRESRWPRPGTPATSARRNDRRAPSCR